MNNLIRSTVSIAVLCGSGLWGCSRETALAKGPTDDPCALVSDADVRKLFPGAHPGVRDHSLDAYGIATCTWETPANTFVTQLFKAKGTAADEARSRAAGSVDPVMPGAGATIQYVNVAGVGDEATAVAEPADSSRGVLAETAVIAIRHGGRMAVLSSRVLVNANRAVTLEALGALGRSAAARL